MLAEGGLLVGGDVSVGLSLGGLPWGGGVRRVGDGSDAVRQGARHQAFDPCTGPREAPCCCHADQTRRKSERKRGIMK